MSFWRKFEIKKGYIPAIIIGMLILAGAIYAGTYNPNCQGSRYNVSANTFDCYRVPGTNGGTPQVQVNEWGDNFCLQNLNALDILVPTQTGSSSATELGSFTAHAPNVVITPGNCNGNNGPGPATTFGPVSGEGISCKNIQQAKEAAIENAASTIEKSNSIPQDEITALNQYMTDYTSTNGNNGALPFTETVSGYSFTGVLTSYYTEDDVEQCAAHPGLPGGEGRVAEGDLSGSKTQ